MSNETTSVVLSICGIAAVVGVLIVLAAFLLLRVLKFSIFGIAINAMRVLTDPKEEPTALDVRAQVARPITHDLRTQAKSIDFDAAVARQRQEANQTTQPTAYSAQTAAPNQAIQPPTTATATFPAQSAPFTPIQPTPLAPNPNLPQGFTTPGQPIQPPTTTTNTFPTQTLGPAPGFTAPLRRPKRKRSLTEEEVENDDLFGGMLDGDDIL